MGIGQHTQYQRQSQWGWKQASPSFRKMKYRRVLIHCISSQIPGRPGAYLLNGLLLRPIRTRSSYTFSHKDKTRRQKKRRVQTFASCSCFLVAGGSEDLWADILPWTLPCVDLSAPSPPWSGVQGYRLTQEPVRTISKQQPWHNSSLLKHAQSALTGNVEEQIWVSGLSSGEFRWSVVPDS